MARAFEYFRESQARGVQPNIFLFNTTISKLAKARKVDHTLELFHSMKKSGVILSSITYGAVMAACCRDGELINFWMPWRLRPSSMCSLPRAAQISCPRTPSDKRLQRSGVHMTAYIANILIRGYAAAGNIEEARKVFEIPQLVSQHHIIMRRMIPRWYGAFRTMSAYIAK
jgi:pentatricopeptide repeat protein